MSDLFHRPPSNRFLVRLPDRRMPRALVTILTMAATLVLMLSVIGWPRLKRTTIHYDLLRLRTEVERLAEEERRLELDLEVERSPIRLQERAGALGLAPPGPFPAMSLSDALVAADASRLSWLPQDDPSERPRADLAGGER